LAPALRAQGISYWGCPMNGAFRHEPLPVFGDRLANAQSWWKRCHAIGAEGFLVTGWEPNRLALPTTMVVDAAIAGLWLADEPFDQVTLLSRGLTRVHGPTGAAEFARLILACDERAFSGYARWETHQHWDTVQGRDGPGRHAADERVFARAAATRYLPSAFAASLRWRHYLAGRDRLIHDLAARTLRARRLLARHRHKNLDTLIAATLRELDDFARLLDRGRDAAEAMWLET